jgi:hypothetical protein
VLAACAQASIATADRVVLVSGAVLEGKVERDGDKVVVETDSGKVALPADMVKRIEASHSDVQEFEARLARLARDDVAGLLALANYCRDHEMPARETEVLLGYVKTPSGWMTQDELMEARGMVKYEGQWISREQLHEIESSLLDAQAAQLDGERERARALQAEFDAEQGEYQSWFGTQTPAYSTYWYGYGSGFSYGSGRHYRPYGHSSGYMPERRFSYGTAGAYRPPPVTRSAPAPVPRPMGDVHAVHVSHHRSTR